MMPQTQLRHAVASDLNSILALDRATENAPHWPLSSYAAVLEAGEQSAEAPNRCLLVACRDTLLVGFAVGLVSPAPPDPAVCIAELESVVVASAARRAGLGRALCDAALAWCNARGATEVILEVRAASSGAIALYAALGFTQTGRRPDYYRNPADDAVIMRLPLFLADLPTSPQVLGDAPA
jgi:ribosomal-protein-alanine N-acetyltransferase